VLCLGFARELAQPAATGAARHRGGADYEASEALIIEAEHDLDRDGGGARARQATGAVNLSLLTEGQKSAPRGADSPKRGPGRHGRTGKSNVDHIDSVRRCTLTRRVPSALRAGLPARR